MTELLKALYSFWSQFGIEAYVEDSVPSDAVLPYITYSVNKPSWNSQTVSNARIWYRGSSFAGIASMVDIVSATIGEGISIHTANGSVYMFKDDNFIQFQNMDEIKVAYLSMILHVNFKEENES